MAVSFHSAETGTVKHPGTIKPVIWSGALLQYISTILAVLLLPVFTYAIVNTIITIDMSLRAHSISVIPYIILTFLTLACIAVESFPFLVYFKRH